MKKIKIRPISEKVRKPDGSTLLKDGESVSETPYWLRRLKEKDVELIRETSGNTGKQSSKATEKISK